MTKQSELLQPSLAENQPLPQPSFSLYSHFLMGFFGGPLAILVYSYMGLNRMDKLKDKLPLSILLTLVSFSVMLFSFYLARNGYYSTWIEGVSDNTIARRANNLLGVLIFGGFYLIHRKSYAMSENHPESVNPWNAVGVSLAFGWTTQYLIYLQFGVS